MRACEHAYKKKKKTMNDVRPYSHTSHICKIVYPRTLLTEMKAEFRGYNNQNVYIIHFNIDKNNSAFPG